MAVSEREARHVAEEARETDWKKPSFLKELFLGSLRFDLVPDFPPLEERPEFRVFFRWLGWGRWPRFGEYGSLAPHVRFLDRTSRKLARAHQMSRESLPDAASAADLADLFCRGARRKIAAKLRGISSNDDVAKYAAARRLLDGKYGWLETDLVSGLFRKPDEAAAAAPHNAPAGELVSSR